MEMFTHMMSVRAGSPWFAWPLTGNAYNGEKARKVQNFMKNELGPLLADGASTGTGKPLEMNILERLQIANDVLLH